MPFSQEEVRNEITAEIQGLYLWRPARSRKNHWIPREGKNPDGQTTPDQVLAGDIEELVEAGAPGKRIFKAPDCKLQPEGTTTMNSMYLKVKQEGGRAYRLSVSGWIPIPEGEVQPCAPAGGGVVIRADGGALVAVRTDGDREVYRCALADEGRMYKLGPNFGYRVKLPDEEEDPILRVARTIGIPANKVSGLLPPGTPVQVAPGETVSTDGRVTPDGKVVGYTYVIRTFTKHMRSGVRGRFVSGVGRTAGLKPDQFREACEGLRLAHRPEWLVNDPSRGAAA